MVQDDVKSLFTCVSLHVHKMYIHIAFCQPLLTGGSVIFGLTREQGNTSYLGRFVGRLLSNLFGGLVLRNSITL